ncbi:MAG: HI0074 family nucleotidyltransferase substrate-binding subunit [Legionellaceae bacterium]|nr:HI0074 family nucleotidyltransferase substrate-binding subunit [Legionellaceae bacterium]
MTDTKKSGEIYLTPLLKAQKKFEDFRQHLNTDQEKAGAIQAFEYSFELAWKTLKRILKYKGLDVGSPRDTFRVAAQNHLLNDVEKWFQFLVKRNLTTHTYNDEVMDEVIAIFHEFSVELLALTKTLQAEIL